MNAAIRQVPSVVMVLLASGCSMTSVRIQEQIASHEFAEDSRELSDELISLHNVVPYVPPAHENSCGVTCLDMILEYEGRSLPVATRHALLESVVEDESVTQGALKKALEDVGFLAIHLQGEARWPEDGSYQSWKNPFFHVESGRPPILRVATDEGLSHFVVLVGFDPETRSIVVMNPGRGAEVWSLARFEQWWGRGDRWFVAYKEPSEHS